MSTLSKAKLVIAALAAAMLTACGGGSSGGSTTAVVPATSVTPVALFATTPQLLPDLRVKYDSLCGDEVSVQNAIPANLTGHTDGKKDLVFNLWCMQKVMGQFTNEPVPNGMVAFIQQADGSFIDGTRTLFGVDMVDLGGIGIDAAVYDFNGDGRDEIIFAVNKEDGRMEPHGGTSNNVQKVFITSHNGIYSVERLGNLSHNYRIALVDNELGGKDIVTTPIGYGGTIEAWRLSSTWNQITGYDWVGQDGNAFFRRKKTSENSQIAVVRSPWPAVGVDLYTRSLNSDWSNSSSWSFSTTQKTVPWLSWNQSLATVNMVTINNKDYVNVGYEMGCELKKTPASESIAVALITSSEIKGGYQGGVVIESGLFLASSTKLIGLNVYGGQLTDANLSVTNEDGDSMPLKMTCGDVNGDGYDDIVIDTWGNNAQPIIYLNDGTGNFLKVDKTKLPTPSADFRYSSMHYVDITGDGVRDMLYWPLASVNNSPTTVRFELFKGLRTMLKTDQNN